MSEYSEAFANDEVEDRRRVAKTNRQFIAKVGVGLLLGFAFSCSLGYMVGYARLGDSLDREARLFIKDILFAIGTACAVSLIFGFLLELPQTSDYVAEKLSDLIFGDEYLRRITNSLPMFRRRIDRVLFGEAEVASHQSLYNFMEGRLQTLYRASFRRNMYVEMRCSEHSGSTLLWRQKTAYTYVRNPLDRNESVIRSRRTLDVASLFMPADLGDKKKAFNDIVLRLFVRIGEHEYESSADDRTVLTRLKKKDISAAKMPETISVDYEFKTAKLNYSLACGLPMEMVINTNELFVEIHDDHLTLREPGNLVYSGVAAPTENFTLDCFFPDATRLEPARFFWQGLQRMSDLRTEFGAISVKIPGWLLQGEGGCVAWFFQPNDAAVATAENSDVHAKPPDVSET